MTDIDRQEMFIRTKNPDVGKNNPGAQQFVFLAVMVSGPTI